MQKYKSRKDVPEKYKWDLTTIYKNEKKFDEAYNTLKYNIKKLASYKGCTNNCDKLYDFLKLDTETAALTYKVNIYKFEIFL